MLFLQLPSAQCMTYQQPWASAEGGMRLPGF